jgi:hypothetical protein
MTRSGSFHSRPDCTLLSGGTILIDNGLLYLFTLGL